MATEPFPAVSTPSSTKPSSSNAATTTLKNRRRRVSSSLGADPRGDTGAAALATSNLKQPSPPRSESNASSSSTSSHPPGPKESGRKRRKAKSYLRRFKRVCLKHTWVAPLLLVTVILALYAISPGPHNPLHAAIFLSYANPPLHERTDTLPAHIGPVTQYGKGPKDFAFVAFYTIVLSFTREFLMQRLIRPLGLRAGIRGRGKLARFMEQAYTAIYFAIFGPFGLYVMSRSPVWYFNTAGMYAGFPHRAHEAYFKAYYLLQGAYWAQQAIVLMLMLEKPRKDFRELVLHHIITLSLIGLSYRFHFTYMGVAVYITHDISDFFLATSKVLNYLDHWATPPYFVLFIGIWAYLRHIINLRILYSLQPLTLPFLTIPPNEFATVGPYDLDFPSQQYKCWISQAITFSLLAALQAVNAFWFFLIVRILVRIVWKGVQKDDRSDEEDEELTLEEIEGLVVVPPYVNGSVKKELREEGEGEEERVEQKTNGTAGTPRITLNGGDVNGVAGSTGLEEVVSARKATLRKKR